MTRTGMVFLHSSDEGYGSDRILVQLVRAALDGCYDVTVMLPDDTGPGWLSDTLGKLDVAVTKGPLAPARRRYLTPRQFPVYLRSVVRARRFIKDELRRIDPAVLHVNSTALPVVALARRPAGTKLVWHVHEILVSPPALALLFRLVPLLSASRIVAISDAVATHMARLRIHRHRIVRVYNGVEPRHPEPDREDDGRVTAIYVGRLSAWKGYDLFIDALAEASGRIPGLWGVVAGGPPPGEEWRADDLLRRIAQAGLDSTVKYLGFVDDVGQLFRPGRIVVVPSRWPEPFGLVTVEAMLAGCVVVASRHGGSAEIIEDGVTGMLVPPGDSSALAAALERLAVDPDRRDELGAQARISAEARFRPEAFASAMLGVWKELATR
jgi:glycosyltransferase involved in cell wall biosynthesis